MAVTMVASMAFQTAGRMATPTVVQMVARTEGTMVEK
jgi:hypothetical protein